MARLLVDSEGNCRITLTFKLQDRPLQAAFFKRHTSSGAASMALEKILSKTAIDEMLQEVKLANQRIKALSDYVMSENINIMGEEKIDTIDETLKAASSLSSGFMS